MQLGDENNGVQPEVIDTPVENNAVETEEVSADAEAEGEDTDDGGDITQEMKTIKKALNKKNRYIDNQRSKIRNLEAQMQQLKSQSINKADAPVMEKFDSVIDYMKADQSYTLDQKLAEQAQNQQFAALKYQQELAFAEQAKIIEQQVVELSKANPDFQKVIAENSQVFSAMPDHINAILTELDNGHIAAYALAKEGRMASVYSMPPHIAAAHLVQAEIRGEQYLQQSARVQKQAPQPIGSLKGAGKSSTKSLGQMSPNELDKWRKS